jgi:hypothetical protein
MSKQVMRGSWLGACGALAVLGSLLACGPAGAEEPKCHCPVRVDVRESGLPMLTKLPYVNRLFRNVGVGRDCPGGACHEPIGIDVAVAVAHSPSCQSAKACDKACPEVATSAPACEKKCAACPCTAAVSAVATACSAAKACSGEAGCPVASGSPVASACPLARTCPVAGAWFTANCPCAEKCSTAACDENQCPAAAQCAQNRLGTPVLPIFSFFGGGEVIPCPPPIAAPWNGPLAGWEPPPSIWEYQQAVIEISAEKAGLEAVLEAREQIHTERSEMFESLAELLAEKGKAEARSEMFEVLAKVLVEKAKLEAHVEAQAQHVKLNAEMHKLLVENARLKAHGELASQREELMREALQLALENERLKHRVAELERHQHSGAARTAAKPHTSGEAR